MATKHNTPINSPKQSEQFKKAFIRHYAALPLAPDPPKPRSRRSTLALAHSASVTAVIYRVLIRVVRGER
jgi:hypothetical protein